MYQVKIGKFIADSRKEKCLTQAQLAEKLGVTNRAVSKWETGKSMPDASLILMLCEILDISTNELLCGKRLSEDDQKAESEKNTMAYLVTKEELESLQILTEILVCAGIVIACTLTSVVAETVAEKIVTIICGVFVWGFGLWLRIKVRRALGRIS